MEKKNSVSDIDRKNILKALYTLENIIFVEKNNVATSSGEKKKIAPPRNKKTPTYFYSE